VNDKLIGGEHRCDKVRSQQMWGWWTRHLTQRAGWSLG